MLRGSSGVAGYGDPEGKAALGKFDALHDLEDMQVDDIEFGGLRCAYVQPFAVWAGTTKKGAPWSPFTYLFS